MSTVTPAHRHRPRSPHQHDQPIPDLQPRQGNCCRGHLRVRDHRVRQRHDRANDAGLHPRRDQPARRRGPGDRPQRPVRARPHRDFSPAPAWSSWRWNPKPITMSWASWSTPSALCARSTAATSNLHPASALRIRADFIDGMACQWQLRHLAQSGQGAVGRRNHPVGRRQPRPCSLWNTEPHQRRPFSPTRELTVFVSSSSMPPAFT